MGGGTDREADGFTLAPFLVDVLREDVRERFGMVALRVLFFCMAAAFFVADPLTPHLIFTFLS